MMIRRTLLLLTVSAMLCGVGLADDPPLPTPGGPTLGIDPIPSGTLTPSETYPSYQAAPEYNSYEPTPHVVQPTAPVQGRTLAPYSVPMQTQTYSSVPLTASTLPAASGCACNRGGSTYSASSLGIPAGPPAAGVGFGYLGYTAMGYHGGGMETYTGAAGAGMHVRHPYYSYRRPWYANGPMSRNVTIAW